MKYLTVVFLLAATACSTNATSPESFTSVNREPGPSKEYAEVVSRWTQQDRRFDSLTETYHAAATLLSRELAESQVSRESEVLKWTPEQTQEARQKALYDLQSDTTFVVSIFTQKDEDNNLDKSGSVWNVFLEVNGKRVNPQSIKRIYENRAVFSQKYPHVMVWSRNYFVKFPVPTDDTISSKGELTLAGPFGTAKMTYPAR